MPEPSLQLTSSNGYIVCILQLYCTHCVYVYAAGEAVEAAAMSGDRRIGIS